MVAEKFALAIKIEDCSLVVRRESIDNKRLVSEIRTVLALFLCSDGI